MENLKVTRKNAMESFCHDCMGQYVDGKTDCENVKCSLYSFMPYAKKEPNLEWTEHHSRKNGIVLMSSIEHVEMTDLQKLELKERFKR